MQLSSKGLYYIELGCKYARYDLIESLEEYHFLLDTLIYIHESVSEQKTEIPHWQKLSETLVYKFYLHGMSLHNILSGLAFKSQYYKESISDIQMIDISSAKVVIRAQFETFLIYHHIYVNPDRVDLKQLRYYA